MHKAQYFLILHAHLPFIKHPEDENFLEELWFYEALSETYIPLLKFLQKIKKENLNFKINISLSPTLLSMLDDNLLKNRFISFLEKRIKLSEKEIIRTKNNPKLNELAKFYYKFFSDTLKIYTDELQTNIIEKFKKFYQEDIIELFTTSATHAFLPFFEFQPDLVNAQIKIGLKTFQYYFGFSPEGIWIPECGYYDGLDNILLKNNIKYTIVDSHAFLFGKPKPITSIYLPVKTQKGLTLFARDMNLSELIWNAQTGYPGNEYYREFHKDLSSELSYEELKPCTHPAGFRMNTSIKYYRISDKNSDNKKLYDIKKAQFQTKIDAEDYISKLKTIAEDLISYINIPPVIVTPFDAELFGHWWFEGIDFIYEFAKKLNNNTQLLCTSKLSDYIKKFPPVLNCEPSPSSWGLNGYNEMWLNNRTDWIYPLVHQTGDFYLNLISNISTSSLNKVQEKIILQMGKELLLAQSSDWPFIIRSQTTTKYATFRVKDHIANFYKLYNMYKTNQIDIDYLNKRCNQYNLFKNISINDFKEK